MEEHRTSAAQSAALWLVAVGLVLTGYGAWEQWGTDLVAWHNQQEAMNDLANGWPDPDDAKPGQTIAVLRIPAFGEDFKVPQVYQSYGDATQINLEAMLRVQLYFGGIIGIHAEVGPVLAIIDEGGGVLGDSWYGTPEGVYFDIPSDLLLASFGVVVYLP